MKEIKMGKNEALVKRLCKERKERLDEEYGRETSARYLENKMLY